MAEGKITARFIIQMAGAPKEHIERTIRAYIEKIKDEYDDIKVISEEYSDAEKQENDKLWDIFVELEAEFGSMGRIMEFCIDYMPSSVEILSPAEFVLKANEFSNFLNDIQLKLHQVDMAIKNLSAENKVLEKNALTLVKNMIMVELKKDALDLKTLAKEAGMPEDHMLKFLNALKKEGKIVEENGLYMRPAKQKNEKDKDKQGK